MLILLTFLDLFEFRPEHKRAEYDELYEIKREEIAKVITALSEGAPNLHDNV